MVETTRLEELLREKGWTRGRLAEELGVSRQVLHRWMSGRPRLHRGRARVDAFPAPRARQVAELLGVPFSELFEPVNDDGGT